MELDVENKTPSFNWLVYAVFLPGNTKGGSITVPLTSCLTGLDWTVLKIKTKIVSCHIANSKPVKQEVNGTAILPPLVFPGSDYEVPTKKILTLDTITPQLKSHLRFDIAIGKHLPDQKCWFSYQGG
jgi:hypothetical protein